MALPATISPTTPLGSDLKSDGDNQLRALKQFIVDVLGLPAGTPINNAAFSITTGGLVTVPQAMTLSSTLSANDKVTLKPGVSGRTPHADFDDLVIEGAASAGVGISFLSPAAGLAAGIAWGDSDNDVAQLTYTHSDGRFRVLAESGLYFKDAGLTHGMSSSVEESTFLSLLAITGAEFRCYGSSTYGARMQGAVTTASSATSTAATGALWFDGIKKFGTTTQPLDTTENIIVFQSGGTTRHIFANDGDIHLDGVSNDNVFDDYDDLKLLTAARASLMPNCDFKEQFADWVREYAPVLAQGKIITYNDDGHHFISYKGMQGLMIDTIRQLGERIICLEQRQQIASSGSTIKRLWKRALPRLRSTFASARLKS